MTSALAGPALNASPFVPLTRPDLLIDREDDARNVVRSILDAGTQIIIFHGPTNSGKTQLIKQWVIPAIQAAVNAAGKNVLYAECDPRVPSFFEGTRVRLGDVIGQEGFLFIDQIERVVELPREDQRSELERLFNQVKRKGNRAVLILVADSRQLTSVYSSASFDVQSQPLVCELPVVTVAQALIRLSEGETSGIPVYSQEVLTAIATECMALEARGWSDSFELAKLIHNHCGAYQARNGIERIDLGDYKSIGSVLDMLRARLEHQLEVLEEEREGDGELARSVLESALRVDQERSVSSRADVAARIGSSPEEIERIIRAMSDFGLVRVKGGILRVVPPQLLAIIEEDLKGRQRFIERAEHTVVEGLSSWTTLESLLTRSRFDEIHAERRHLTLDSDQVNFLLRCALQFEDSHCPGAVEYWLNRAHSEDGLEVLLGSLFHKFEDVRSRAATILGGYPLPAVREKLLTVALTDEDPDVRAQAVASLEGMSTGILKDNALKDQLLREVNDRGSPYRQQAIECLRLVPTPEIARVLKQQVNDTGAELAVRLTSIRVLSTLGTDEAVDTLIDIAFDDVDQDDREAAATALGSIDSTDLNRRVFERLAKRDSRRVWTTRLVLGFVALVSVPVVFGTLSATIVTTTWLIVLFLALVPTFLLMARLAEGRTPVKSPLGILGLLLFALEAITLFPIVHGLAHLTIKMPRRAIRILECELLAGLSFLVAYYVFEDAPWATVSYWVFLSAALLLFIGSYLYDVVEVLNAVISREALLVRQRQRAVYRQLFSNPVAAKLVFDSLQTESGNGIPSAKRLLARFYRQIGAAQLVGLLQERNAAYSEVAARALSKAKPEDAVARLEDVWSSDKSLRKTIARILYQDPNELSLAALRRMRFGLDRWDSIRARAAWWFYPFAVLPRSLKVAGIVLILLIVPGVYYGLRARNNVTWPQIVSLKQSRLRNDQKFETIRFLGMIYPGEAGGELFSMLKNRHDSPPDSVNAALTEALATIDPDSVGVTSQELRRELDTSVGKHSALLVAARDSTDLLLAVRVLRYVASGRDSILADKASASLAAYIGSAASQGHPLARKYAIESLASAPYSRALPLLDKLISDQIERRDPSRPPEPPSDLSEELSKASYQVYSTNLDPDSVAGRQRLLRTLRGLNNPPPRLVPNLTWYVDRDSRIPGICRDAGLLCDDAARQSWAMAEALENISQQPSNELAYRQLLAYYEKDGRYDTAAVRLEHFQRRSPNEVWPRKLLAEVFHEHLALSDTAYFGRSYKVMEELRHHAAYDALRQSRPADFGRVETDFIEIAFSAGHFTEADRVAERIRVTSDDTTEIFNAALFGYFSNVLAGDRSTSLSRLTQLDSVVRSFPEGFTNNWVYPGTIKFINAAKIPSGLKVALLKLAKTGRWYPRAEASAIFEENRNAVGQLTTAAR